MKKYLILALLGLVTLVNSASAITISQSVLPNSMTNLLSVYNGAAQVSQIIITATTATNASVLFIDTPTNQLTYILGAYSNRVSYATNYVTSWTNYYGVAQSTTNLALIDITNSVASTTNFWPQRLSVAAAASTSARFDQVNYYFNQGIWITNTGSGNATVTITYHQ